MNGAVDPRAGQLVTMTQAAERLGKTRTYFYVQRDRFRTHSDPEKRFPQPITEIAGADVYDLLTLVLWDEKRRRTDEAKRAGWAAKKEHDHDISK